MGNAMTGQLNLNMYVFKHSAKQSFLGVEPKSSTAREILIELCSRLLYVQQCAITCQIMLIREICMQNS